jgi:arylsulfatase
MPTVDEEFTQAAFQFIDKAAADKKPFFVWMNTTRMHVWTHLKPESYGKSGVGLYADGMLELDAVVGRFRQKLDELGIAENTILVFSTDNGAEKVSWPDGGTTPFHGEKGTTFEGGLRVPMMVRWPGVVKPGTIYNEMISQEDWLPTLVAAAGDADVAEECRQGCKAAGKDYKVHLDGFNFLPFFKGEAQESPRDTIYYFGQGGELNAVRWADWKVNFTEVQGNIASGSRTATNWPLIVNLRADPYEQTPTEAEMGYLRWYADNMWLFVPVQQKIREFLQTIPAFPFQQGGSLNAASINYQSLRAAEALKRLEDLETFQVPVGQ